MQFKKTLAAQTAYLDIDDAIQLHNARVLRDVKKSKQALALLTDREAVLDYVISKVYSPDNQNWGLVASRYIRYVA